MAEPTTTTTGGTFILFKFITLLLPVGASLIAFWLGVRFVPLRKGHEWTDVINRIVACFISAFILGVAALIVLYNHCPGLFDAALKLAVQAQLPPEAGFFILTGCVMVVCSLPGPWLIAAIFLWLERRKEKDIEEILTGIHKPGLHRKPTGNKHE